MPTAPRRPTQEMNSFSRLAEPERPEAEEHRGRPRDEHQRERDRQRRQDGLRQAARPGQQAKDHEHADLREPGRGVEERHQRVVGAGRAVADHQARRYRPRESRSRATDCVTREDHHRGGRDERRVQALRQVEPVEHQHHQPAAEIADQAAEHEFAGQQHGDAAPRPVAEQQVFDQRDGEEDRDRIVEPGFDLQRGVDARPQPQALGVQQEEHGGGVGRGHHGAGQQRLRPAHAQREHRSRRGQRGGDHDAGRRQRPGRAEHVAEGLEPGAQAAVEQDQAERHRAHRIGHLDVVEDDAAGAGFAGQHADQQEREQQRRAEPQRDQARHDAGQHQQRAQQQREADCVERLHRRSLPVSYWQRDATASHSGAQSLTNLPVWRERSTERSEVG